MDILFALLMWLGVASGDTEITQTLIDQHQSAIQEHIDDQDFLLYFESQRDGITQIDLSEM